MFEKLAVLEDSSYSMEPFAFSDSEEEVSSIPRQNNSSLVKFNEKELFNPTEYAIKELEKMHDLQFIQGIESDQLQLMAQKEPKNLMVQNSCKSNISSCQTNILNDSSNARSFSEELDSVVSEIQPLVIFEPKEETKKPSCGDFEMIQEKDTILMKAQTLEETQEGIYRWVNDFYLSENDDQLDSFILPGDMPYHNCKCIYISINCLFSPYLN